MPAAFGDDGVAQVALPQEGDERTDSPPAPPAPVERPGPPARVSFRLLEGLRLISGALEGWDEEGLTGAFGTYRWAEIHHEDVWALGRRLMDADSAQAWVALGHRLLRLSLDQPRAAVSAETAFRRAHRLDPAVQEHIDAARDAVAQERARREALEAEAERQRLRTVSPEAGPWTATPWPLLSERERADAVDTVRAEADRILERAGMVLRPIETDHFLFYSEQPRARQERWVRDLDRMYRMLSHEFEIPVRPGIFWGKAVIIVTDERDRFRLMLAQSFRHMAPRWVDGMFFPMGPQSYVIFCVPPRDDIFAALLVHETTHAFMHRFISPVRLPTWANEGFADRMVARLMPENAAIRDRRRQGVAWIRSGGHPLEMLGWYYGDGSWPGEEGIGYSIGYLLVELMARERPDAFIAWIRAIKHGMPWEEALRREFGATPASLADALVRWHLVND